MISVLATATEEWGCKLLLSLAKADNFDMTLMFLEDREKELLERISSQSGDQLGKQLRTKYQL